VAMLVEFPLQKREQRLVGVKVLDNVVVGNTPRERLGITTISYALTKSSARRVWLYPAFAQPTSHVSIAQSLWTITLHIQYDAKFPD
jgi:hypothetical protein